MTKEQIRTFRKSLKLKQQEFADQLGYNRCQINLVENGKRPVSKKLINQIKMVYDTKRI